MAHPSVMIAGLIVGSDPEIRFTPKGGKTARVSLLTKSRRKKRGSDEYIEDPQWNQVTFYGVLAETVETYIKKGDRNFVVSGHLELKQRDGKFYTNIIAEQIEGFPVSGDRISPLKEGVDPVDDDFDPEIPF